VEVFRAVGDEDVRVEVEVDESGLARIRILSRDRFLEADLPNGVVFLYEVSEEGREGSEEADGEEGVFGVQAPPKGLGLVRPRPMGQG